jgi:hypothetical protein
LIEGALQEAVEAATGLDQLTWGTCYGDGPELLNTSGGLALIDWGAVTRAPLLWDVFRWASEAGLGADRLVAAYVDAGGRAAGDVDQFPVMQRLGAAHQLRFRSFRLANGTHYDESASEDRAALVRAAMTLGVDYAAILDAIS